MEDSLADRSPESPPMNDEVQDIDFGMVIMPFLPPDVTAQLPALMLG